jgi:signal transduction histidine kinase/ligand-binding sensor domain-containing protein
VTITRLESLVAPAPPPALAWTAILAVSLAVGAAHAERLPLRVFNSANGLRNDFVTVVRQDSRGLLWFGTDGGVSRFDGNTFRNYGRDEGIPEGEVSDVLETRSGELLFATGGGLCRLLPPTPAAEAARGRKLFGCIAAGDSPQASDVRDLHEDRFGQLWAGTAAGLYRVERGRASWRLVRVRLGLAGFGPWNEEGIREIVEEPSGALWLATAVGVAHRETNGQVTQYRVRGADDDDRVFKLLLDRGGRLWIGHVDDGVFVWKPPPGFVPPPGWSIAGAAMAAKRHGDGGGAIRLPRAPGEAIRIAEREGLPDGRARTGLLEDRDGTIWIGTVRGLARFREGRLDSFGLRNGLPDDGVRPTLIDRAGNLWLGSPSGGAARLRRGGFTTYDETDGLRGFRIRSILEGRDGTLYVLSAAERDFVQRFDGERFEAVAPKLPPPLTYTGWWIGQVGLEDREGDWWLPTGLDGVLRYPAASPLDALAAPGYRSHYRGGDEPGSAGAQVLYEDRQGDIWIGGFAEPHLTVWRRSTGRFERFDTQKAGLPHNAPTVFREDAAGRLWIGFGDGALGWLRDGRLLRVPPAVLPPHLSAVYDLTFDRSGRLWVASIGGGLLRLDDPQAPRPAVRAYTVADGLASSDVSCVVEDPKGQIYACAGQGIDRLDPSSGAVRHFTTADGLANNLVRLAFRDRRGQMWFGTMQGLSRLRVTPDTEPSAVAALITGVEIDGAPMALPETGVATIGGPRYAVHAGRLRVAFAAPGGDLDAEPSYQYRLRPVETAWAAPTRDRSVTYAGLGAGRHRFEVRAVADGIVGPSAVVQLTVLPPWWRSTWALAGFAMLIVGTAYALHRQRVARLLAIERVRSRIAADLHDDLGASLSRIAVLSEVARRKGADGDGAPELRQIADTARQLTDEASDIVWSIDPHHDDLGSLLFRLRRLAADLLGERGIALDFAAPGNAESIRLSADQRRHLLMVLKEALHNAARHAGARRVEVHIEATGSVLRAMVRDDGRGFDAVTGVSANGGRGLPSLRSRARELGGSVEVRSEPGAGTTVTLSMPR